MCFEIESTSTDPLATSEDGVRLLGKNRAVVASLVSESALSAVKRALSNASTFVAMTLRLVRDSGRLTDDA